MELGKPRWTIGNSGDRILNSMSCRSSPFSGPWAGHCPAIRQAEKRCLKRIGLVSPDSRVFTSRMARTWYMGGLHDEGILRNASEGPW